MSEKVIVRQDSDFMIEFQAVDPEKPDSDEFEPVHHLHGLTPYGMLLASLGSCTTIVLHTYAQYHDIDLQEVKVRLQYERAFQEDCENCEEIEKYEEQIQEKIALAGDLSSKERKKLLHIAHQCSINKMLQQGITVQSELLETT